MHITELGIYYRWSIVTSEGKHILRKNLQLAPLAFLGLNNCYLSGWPPVAVGVPCRDIAGQTEQWLCSNLFPSLHQHTIALDRLPLGIPSRQSMLNVNY